MLDKITKNNKVMGVVAIATLVLVAVALYRQNKQTVTITAGGEA